MNILYYLKKLLNATPDELMFRIKRKFRILWDQIYSNSDRLRFLEGIDTTIIGSHSVTPIQYKQFWERKKNFYFSPQDRQSMIDVFEVEFPGYIHTILVNADEILSMNIQLFDRTVTYTEKIDWNMDPLLKKPWPKKHWSNISVVRSKYQLDAKWVWELNRHQFLIIVAIAFWYSRDEKYSNFICHQLIQWIDDNPIDTGINWVESLEVATRVISWIWILELLRGSNSLTPDLLIRILDSLIRQAYHVCRYLSFYISPNTHLIGEALGLFILGRTYPEYGLSTQWSEKALKILEAEIVTQVGDDGVHKELSTYYHCYTVDYYFQYLILALKQNITVSSHVPEILGRMLDFLMMVQRPDGSIPMLGDGDGGRALPLSAKDYISNPAALSLGALYFERPDLKFQAQRLSEDCIWFLGPDCVEKYKSLKAEEPEKRSVFFSDSNYIVTRSDWKPDAHYMAFDCGQMGYLSAGHSHADYLHFELTMNGEPMLVDIGTCSYKDGHWRDYCRSTIAHNTVCVDGKNQARFRGEFGWLDIPEKGTGKLQEGPGFSVVQGIYKCHNDIVQSRSFLCYDKYFFLCTDVFQVEGPHQYDYAFHLAPGLRLSEEDRSLLIKSSQNSFLRLQPLFFEDSSVIIEKGDETTPFGWYFPTYGSRKECITVRIQEEVTDSFQRYVVFLPFREHEKSKYTIREKRFDTGESEIEILHHETRFIIRDADQKFSTIKMHNFSVSGERAISEWRHDTCTKFVSFNTKFLEYSGEILVRSEFPMSYCVLENTHANWNVYAPDRARVNKNCRLFQGAKVNHIRVVE